MVRWMRRAPERAGLGRARLGAELVAVAGRVALGRGEAAPAAGDDADRPRVDRETDAILGSWGSHGTSFRAYTIAHKKPFSNL